MSSDEYYNLLAFESGNYNRFQTINLMMRFFVNYTIVENRAFYFAISSIQHSGAKSLRALFECTLLTLSFIRKNLLIQCVAIYFDQLNFKSFTVFFILIFLIYIFFDGKYLSFMVFFINTRGKNYLQTKQENTKILLISLYLLSNIFCC